MDHKLEGDSSCIDEEREKIISQMVHPQCEFFYDPSQRGFFLEDSEKFSKCILKYNIPQKYLENSVQSLNQKLKNEKIESIPAPETVYDKRTNTLMKIASFCLFAFFILTVLDVYVEKSVVFFIFGIIMFAAGLLALITIVMLNGDFRKQRSSRFLVSQKQTQLIHEIFNEDEASVNATLNEYGVYLKLNHYASKLRLLPLDS